MYTDSRVDDLPERIRNKALGGCFRVYSTLMCLLNDHIIFAFCFCLLACLSVCRLAVSKMCLRVCPCACVCVGGRLLAYVLELERAHTRTRE